MFTKERTNSLEPLSKFEKRFSLLCISLTFILAIVLCLCNGNAKIHMEVSHNERLNVVTANFNSDLEKVSESIDELAKNLKAQKNKIEIINGMFEEIQTSIDEISLEENNEVNTTNINELNEGLQKINGWLEMINDDCSSAYKKYNELCLTVERKKNNSDFQMVRRTASHKSRGVYPISYVAEKGQVDFNLTLVKFDGDLENLKSYLYNVSEDVGFAYITYVRLNEQVNDLRDVLDFEEMKRSLKAKLSTVDASSNADISKVIGLTEEEIRYLLDCSGLIQDPKIIEVLPKIMPIAVKDYPVNEMWSLAVMALECGHFTSNLAVNYYNYGGIMGEDGPIHYDSVDEGIYKAVRCLNRNLQGNNTIIDVNQTYCEEKTSNGVREHTWSDAVMSVLNLYLNSDLD